MAAACVIPACDRRQQSDGLCAAHFKRWQRRGEDADLVTSIGPSPKAMSATPWNPWTGRQPCPTCGSSAWTMPYATDSRSWRCVKGRWGGCGIFFTPEEA